VSVYKKPAGAVWLYDFRFQGRRFHGSTGQASRRAAEAVERQRRLEAATGQLGAIAGLTLDQAAGRWWQEVGIRRGDAADVERRIARLLKIVGPATPLGEIDQAMIARAIETRRGQTMARGHDRTDPVTGQLVRARRYLPSDATVNRDVVETLRPILKRARSHWPAKGDRHGLPEIDWRALRLAEPRAQSRLYTAAERAAWIAAAERQGDDMDLALDVLLTYGLRFGELFFAPEALGLDPAEPTLTLQKGRKRDVILYLPLRLDHARRLAARQARARAAGLPHLWFRQITIRGVPKLIALTRHQVEHHLSKAADQAGIGGARRIHGARHHAASTILARTGNLKAVQGLLGHASIASSQRYAHVLAADLRAALEDPPAGPAAETPEAAKVGGKAP